MWVLSLYSFRVVEDFWRWCLIGDNEVVFPHVDTFLFGFRFSLFPHTRKLRLWLGGNNIIHNVSSAGLIGSGPACFQPGYRDERSVMWQRDETLRSPSQICNKAPDYSHGYNAERQNVKTCRKLPWHFSFQKKNARTSMRLTSLASSPSFKESQAQLRLGWCGQVTEDPSHSPSQISPITAVAVRFLKLVLITRQLYHRLGLAQDEGK